MATATGLDTTHIGNAIAIARDAYWGNGFDPVKVWDGLGDWRDVGLASYDATPSAGDGAAGAVTSGVHLIRCRYMRGPAEYPGDASTQYSYTAPGAKKVNVSVIGTSASGVDTIVIEMTQAGGATYYEAARVVNSTDTVAVNASDTTLAANLSAQDQYGHFGPRPGSVLVEHKGSLCVGVPAVHTQGTVQVSGTNVIGSSTDWKSVVGDDWWFVASGDTIASRIDSYTGSTAVTLAESHATVAAGATYKMFSPHQNKLEISKTLYPESFGDSNGARRQQEVLQGKSDVLTSYLTWRNRIIIFGEHSMEEYTWTADYTDGRIVQLPGERGTINAKTAKNIEGVLYSWDALGMFRWHGGQPESISGPVDQMFDNVAWTYSDRFHSVFHPEKRLLMWFAATGTHTECRTAFCYNVDSGAWHTRAYDYGWSTAALVPDSLGIMRPFWFDENGYSWLDGIGWRDGAHPTTSVALTADSGCTVNTVTVLSTDSIYNNGGSGMAGVPMWWPSGSVVWHASSNHATSNILYPASALASAPATGAQIYPGVVNYKMRTKAYNIVGTDNEQHMYYLGLDFIPTPQAQTLKIRVYENLSPTAKSDWAASSDGQDGVTFASGDEDILVDLSTESGNVKIPLPDVWNTYVEFEFEVDTPDVRMMLLDHYLICEGEREQEL